MEHSTAALKTQQRSSRFGLWWTLSANFFVFLLMLEAYAVPPGTYVRPMGIGVFDFLPRNTRSAGSAICVRRSLALSEAALAVVHDVLSLTPVPLSSFMLHHAASVRGFYISP
jgi:hypothetical protein